MLEKFYRFSGVAGLNIHAAADGRVFFHAVLVRLKGDQIDIEHQVTAELDINQLKKIIPAKTPLAVNFSGRGILVRSLDIVSDKELDLQKLLPNARPDDFYVQQFHTGTRNFVSLIRRNEADKWTGLLSALGFCPLELSAGAFPVSHLLSQMNVYEQELKFGGFRLTWDEQGNWTNYESSDDYQSGFPLKIGNEKIAEHLLIPYAVAFQLLLSQKVNPVRLENTVINIKHRSAVDDRKWKVNGGVFLCVTFLALCLNFLLLSHYRKENLILSGQVGQRFKDESIFRSALDSVKIKRSLLDSLGWDEGISKSVLLDQAAQLLPAEIVWEKVEINPIYGAERQSDKPLSFIDRQLKITGSSEKIIPVNEWIARLRTKTWVKNIQLISYTYHNDDNKGNFIVLIKY
jgi:hypothetical protein